MAPTQSATDLDDLRYKVGSNFMSSAGPPNSVYVGREAYMRDSPAYMRSQTLHAADAGVLQQFIDFDIYK